MSFGLCEGRGVLAVSPQWDSWVLPNALIRSQNPTKDASVTVARNIGASFRYHSEYHLQQGRETRVPDEPDHGLGAGGSSVFVRRLSITHRRGRYSDCINPRLLNRSHLSACIYPPGLRSWVLTTLLARNKPTRSSIFNLTYPPSLSVSLTRIEYASESDAVGEMAFESHDIGVRVFAYP